MIQMTTLRIRGQPSLGDRFGMMQKIAAACQVQRVEASPAERVLWLSRAVKPAALGLPEVTTEPIFA